MTGRVVTAPFMPTRPDSDSLVRAQEKAEGRCKKGGIDIWPIDVLTKGYVYVVHGYGKINRGTLMGATLANSIFSKSGNGVVFNAAARDLEEIQTLKASMLLCAIGIPPF